MKKHRLVTYFLGSLLIVVFLARLVQNYSYLGYGFVQVGLLSDKICTRGSYEIIICLPDILPPYETILVILAILLTFSSWYATRKTHTGSSNRLALLILVLPIMVRASKWSRSFLHSFVRVLSDA